MSTWLGKAVAAAEVACVRGGRGESGKGRGGGGAQ